MTLTISDKYTVAFRSFQRESSESKHWQGNATVNEQEIIFSFSPALIPGYKNEEPDWQATRKFLEFFFKHLDTIFGKSKNLLIAFLKEFGTYEDFITIDEERMFLGYIEIMNLTNNHFVLNFGLDSDIYYTYEIDFYELYQLLVMIGIRRVGSEL